MIWLPESRIFPEKQIRGVTPEEFLLLVSLYGFIMNLTRIRQRIVGFMIKPYKLTREGSFWGSHSDLLFWECALSGSHIIFLTGFS